MKAVVTLVAALAVAMTAKVASGAATLQISFPAGNETASGVVRGLPAQPDFYHAAPYFSPTAGTRPVVFHSQAALYLRLPTGGWFGPKPSLGSSFPLVTGNRTDGNGSASDTAMRTRAFPFKMRGWSSGAPGDANATHAAVFILPTGTQIPLVTGATQLPAALASMAIASAVCERGGGYVGEASGGTALSAASTINAHAIAAESAAIQTWLEAAGRGAHRTEPAAGTGDSTTMSGAAFAGEFEYPPGPPGPKTAAAGGFISFAGYRWIVKDTGGGFFNPGPNRWSSDPRVVWTDDWGLHLCSAPLTGCNNWAAGEVWLDHALGYGTYLIRYVGPVENLDPEAVFGMFLWDDTASAAIGYREMDFEFARWADAGDPTSSQFVLKPLQAGGPPPGWRMRFTTTRASIWFGSGAGGGACNEDDQDTFNGGGISRVTCVLRWFPTSLRWLCADGMYTIASLASAPGEALLGSYEYAQPSLIPDPGDARIHFNHWMLSGVGTRWRRRSHGIVAGFEFSPSNVEYPQFWQNINVVPANRRRLEAVAATQPVDVAAGPAAVQQGRQFTCGDPSGHAAALSSDIVQAIHVNVSNILAGKAVAADTSTSTLASAGRSIGGAAPVGIIIAATAAAGLAALVAMFAAGYFLAVRGQTAGKGKASYASGGRGAGNAVLPMTSPSAAGSSSSSSSSSSGGSALIDADDTTSAVLPSLPATHIFSPPPLSAASAARSTAAASGIQAAPAYASSSSSHLMHRHHTVEGVGTSTAAEGSGGQIKSSS